MPIETKRLRFREVRESDYQMMVALRNDFDTQGWSRALPPDYTLPMIAKRYESKEFSFRREDATFMIEELDGGRVIGFCGYSGLRDRHSALIGLALITESHGLGYSSETNEMLLDLLFNQMGLLKVGLWTHSGNAAAAASAEKTGFRVSARFREAIFKDSRHFDNLYMDMLREEYHSARSLTDQLGDA